MSASPPVHVNRDPFARATLVRIRDYEVPAGGCAWCGQTKQTPKGDEYLFRYGLDSDSRHGVEWQKPLFDSVGCMRSYFGA